MAAGQDVRAADAEPPAATAATLHHGGRLRPGSHARLARAAFLILTAVLSLHWIVGSLNDYLPKDWSQAYLHDGMADWLAARFWVEGKNAYAPESLAEVSFIWLGHPPTTGFWFIPLAGLERATAAEIVGLSTWLFLLLHIFICVRELGLPSPVACAMLGFSWFLTTGAMMMHWHAIQLSEQIAFLLVVCWAYLRRGREIPAGLALGAAATMKLFPGLIILFLLLTRRFRAFAAAVATYLTVAAVMTAGYGIRSWPMFLAFQDEISKAFMGNIRNGSLQGIILRAWHPMCEGKAEPQKVTTYVALGIGLVLLGAMALLSRRAVRRAREEDPRAIDLPFALISLLAVFLNPWSWEHYYFLLVQPTLVLGAAAVAAFRRTFRDWLDEQVGHGALARAAIVLALFAAGVAVNLWMLRVNVYAKETIEVLWRSHPTPWIHRMLHVMEAINWLPWAITIVLGFLIAWHLRRPESGRAEAAGVRPSPISSS